MIESGRNKSKFKNFYSLTDLEAKKKKTTEKLGK